MKKKWKLTAVLAVILLAGLYYYIALPVVNIHSTETWFMIILLLVILTVLYTLRRRIPREDLRGDKGLRVFIGVILVVGVVYLVGTLLSSPIINARKYQQLMKVEEGNFTEDIEELSFDKIPLLDKDTAELLGDRKMGSMVDMVSQFEADDIYSQINYQDNPVRVTPLKYASLIKWLTNQSEGIPAYIRINMATQSTELVTLEEGMKYTTSEHLNRNIYRHLRFAHPTYMYGELSFEIDEEGIPYWIAPVKKFNIGLFGGETVGIDGITADNSAASDVDVEPVAGGVRLSSDVAKWVRIYDAAGRTVKHFELTQPVTVPLAKGVYIINGERVAVN